MAKLVVYTCESCQKSVEEIFKDTEETPTELDFTCTCGAKLVKGLNFKNNCQVWNWNDRGGL